MHPTPLVIPAVSVTAQLDPKPDLGDADTVDVSLRLLVGLRDTQGTDVKLLALSGPGLTAAVDPTMVANVTAGEFNNLLVEGTISCANWTGLGNVAHFRASSAADTREFEVLVTWDKSVPAAENSAAICAGYFARNPLIVLGASSQLDPVAPVVHTLWRVRNRSLRPLRVTVAAAGLLSEASGSATVLRLQLGVDNASVPPETEASVPVDVQIDSCLNPSAFSSVELEKLDLSLFWSDPASSSSSTQHVTMPTDLLIARLLPDIQAVCTGAPSIGGRT